MTDHRILTDPFIHEPRGASTAVAGQMLQAVGDGTTAWVTPSSTSAALVGVSSLADLPTPVGSVITLGDNKVYEQVDSFSIGSNTIAMGQNCTWKGASRTGITLTHTGSGDVFNTQGNTCSIKDLTVMSPDGRFLNHVTTSPLQRVLVKDVLLTVDRAANLGGVGWVARFENFFTIAISTDGISCSGTCRSFVINGAGSLAVVNGIILDLGTCVFDSLSLDDFTYDLPVGTTFISGLAASANLSANGFAKVSSTTGNVTGGTTLAGVVTGDVKWDFQGNFPIQDTMADGLISMSGNSTSTTLTAGVYALASGTWVVDRVSQFTGTAAGRLTYDGVRNLLTPITIMCVLSPDSGSNNDISVALHKNGTIVTNSALTIEGVSSADSTGVTIPWQEELNPGDYLEVFISTNTGANVTVTSAILRIN